ncbi:MAG: hypothetical protein ACLFS9_03360 [Nitriliruptoraceae bacterium]
MRRPATDGFWRQRARGVASLVLLTVLILAAGAAIAWLVVVVLA